MNIINAKITFAGILSIVLLISCGGNNNPTGPPEATTGTIEISVTTSGDTLDDNGYIITINGTDSLTMDLNDSATFEDVEPGSQEITISGVQMNCDPDERERDVQVIAGETATVNLNVTCRAALFNRIVFHRETSETDFDLFTIAPDGTGEMAIRNTDEADLFPSLSPNGTQVAFQDRSDPDTEIAIMNIDGSGFTKLTDNEDFDGSIVSWSPDGSQVAFSSNRDGDSEIFVMDIDGSNVVQLTENEVLDANPDWSPGGEKILFRSETNLYVMSTDGSNVVQLTDGPELKRSGSWSPDGSRIVFEQGSHIHTMNVDGSDVQQLTTGSDSNRFPSWSPDGSQIVFESNRDGNDQLYIINAEGTGLTRLTNSPTNEDGAPFWGPARTEK